MKLFGFVFVLWAFAFIGDIYEHGIKNVIQQHKTLIDCLLLVVTMIFFVYGCCENAAYSNECKMGEQVDGVILSRNSSPGSRSAEWYYEYDICITDEDICVKAYSGKYYQKEDNVTCYVLASENKKDYKAIIEGSNECKKGNRFITLAGYLLSLEMAIYAFRVH